MSDLFRGRSSTWSAGTPVVDGDQDSVHGYEYSETSIAVQNTTGRTSNSTVATMDQSSVGVGRTGSAYLYSPASSTHTTTELGSQEFSTARRLGSEKTPESSATDCNNNNYNQPFYSASSPRNSRDWAGTGGGGSGSGSGFQVSNFSVHSVSASSPYGRHPDSGGGGGLLTPCGGPYDAPSPYTNGSCQQQQQPGPHSGSPSSAGSHLSSAQQSGMRASGSGGGISSTSAQQSQPGSTNSAKRPARRNPWGSETYSDLIAKAIESYPEKQATLQQIYDYISTNYAFFRERSDPPASAGWKNSIRHNLSLHDKFIKCPKASESSKSSYWRLNANCLNRPYVRRRTCSLDTAGGGSITGKKAKTRLGVGGGGGGGGVGMGAAAKRAVAIAAAAAAAANNASKHSPGGGYADDMLSELPPNRAAAARSHLTSISSGSSSAFSAPGIAAAATIKQEPNILDPWNAPVSSMGFGGNDRKLSQEELNFFHKMQAAETAVSSSSLSLVSGSYEFMMPRAPLSGASVSGRSSISSGVGTSSSISSFCPPPIGRYPSSSFSVEAASSSSSRYPFCDSHNHHLPLQSSCTSSQLSDILTRSAECLEGPGVLEGPQHHPHQHLHQPPQHHFLRATDEMQSMSHHVDAAQSAVPGPHLPTTNSHLHSLLTSGGGGVGNAGGGGGIGPSGSTAGGGGAAAANDDDDDDGGHQDALELQLSLALADRVRNDSAAVSSAVTQWAAATAAAAANRTVENGV